MNEFIPAGHKNWTEFYRKTERKERWSLRFQAFAMFAVLGLALMVDSLTNVI